VDPLYIYIVGSGAVFQFSNSCVPEPLLISLIIFSLSLNQYLWSRKGIGFATWYSTHVGSTVLTIVLSDPLLL
jgi:hypothetical protein